MSEVVARMIARCRSDIKRGVPFERGMEHFTELIKETLAEMDRKIERIEKSRKRKSS